MPLTAATIEGYLQQVLSPNVLTVEDVSHQHAGHSGWREDGGTHFNITIGSEQFADKSRVAVHREVNAALAPAFKQGLHAVQITVAR